MRIFPTTRQITGRGLTWHGYVFDLDTGKALAACKHDHRRRGRTGPNGHFYAMKCAEKMARQTSRSVAADKKG